MPAVPTMCFLWSEAVADPSALESLRVLARRVPYLGRATGAVLSVVENRPDAVELFVHEPCELSEAESALRVPYPGYLDVLRCSHETGRATWEVSRPRRYRVHRPEPPAVRVAPPSPYVDNAVCSTPDRPAPGSWRGGTGHRPGRRRPGHLAVPRAVFPSVIPDGEGQVAAGEQPDGADSLDRTLLGRRRSGAASPGACGHRSAEQGRREYCSLVRRILILLRAT
jgi:CRISPR-associated protein Csb2